MVYPPGSVYDLETLVLQDIKSITTFEPLKEFTKLKSLTFGVSNSRMTIPDLIGLDHATSLESLAFSSKTKIKKYVEIISQMKNLKSLQLFNVEQTLPDHLLSPLHSLQNISFSKIITRVRAFSRIAWSISLCHLMMLKLYPTSPLYPVYARFR